jgi:hypothetical protein
MKATIDGITYSTNATDSELIASRDCPAESVGELRYWEEDLYRTDDGRWFLRGAGGPLTFWAQYHDCISAGVYGEGILPLDPRQASLWLQDAGEVDRWQQYFGGWSFRPTSKPTEPAKPRKSSRAVIREMRDAKAKAKAKAKKHKKAKAKKDTKAVKTLRKASNRALLLARRSKR